MSKYRDELGAFHIPPDLMERIRDYVPPAPKFDKDTPWEVETDDGPTDWTLVETFNSSNGFSVHRVERKRNELRCTCQSFRIQKKGRCKHTDEVKRKLGI